MKRRLPAFHVDDNPIVYGCFKRSGHVLPGCAYYRPAGRISDKVANQISTCGGTAYVPKHRLADWPLSIRRVLADGHVPARQIV